MWFLPLVVAALFFSPRISATNVSGCGSEGRVFEFAIPQNAMGTGIKLRLIILARTTTTTTGTVSHSLGHAAFTATPGTATVLQLPSGLQVPPITGPFSTVIRVSADHTISLAVESAYQYGSSTGVFSVFPADNCSFLLLKTYSPPSERQNFQPTGVTSMPGFRPASPTPTRFSSSIEAAALKFSPCATPRAPGPSLSLPATAMLTPTATTLRVTQRLSASSSSGAGSWVAI